MFEEDERAIRECYEKRDNAHKMRKSLKDEKDVPPELEGFLLRTEKVWGERGFLMRAFPALFWGLRSRIKCCEKDNKKAIGNSYKRLMANDMKMCVCNDLRECEECRELARSLQANGYTHDEIREVVEARPIPVGWKGNEFFEKLVRTIKEMEHAEKD